MTVTVLLPVHHVDISFSLQGNNLVCVRICSAPVFTLILSTMITAPHVRFLVIETLESGGRRVFYWINTLVSSSNMFRLDKLCLWC